jgi:glycosyltransferase involved in cell wall biosynthesis
MKAHLGTDHSPLVVHVIPSPLGRGAQRAARILVDKLHEPGVVRHQLLGLFDGPPEVDLDLDLRYPGGIHAAEGFHPRLALRLRRTLARLSPVAVVAHGGDPMKYVVPAVIGTGCPLAYCVIGTYAGPPSPVHEFRWRQIMARADLVVAVGGEVLEECTGRFGVPSERVVLILNGRDPLQFQPRSAGAQGGAPPTLIFVGAMTPQKQPDRFIEVVGRLRAEGRPLRALLVGDGPLAGPLAAAAAAQGVELLGARPNVAELLRQSDVLVFTSRPAGEGMPGVLIEAGLSGLPVVSTPVPGAATVLVDGVTGFIVEDSVGAVTDAVTLLIDDPVRRAAMGSAARRRCEEEFTLDLMAARWQVALQSMVDPQVRAARCGRTALGRRANAFRRAMRARRGSSHS